MLRKFRPAMFIALLYVIVLALAGCVGQTPPAPTTTTTIATDSAVGAEALAASKEYETAMKDWAKNHLESLEDKYDDMVFQNPLKPTAAEIERARECGEDLRTALTALLEISAPPEIAEAQAQYCAAFHAEVTAYDRLITGIEGTNGADMVVAARMLDEALVLEERSRHALNKYVDLSDVIEN
jgi:hypothetical protein